MRPTATIVIPVWNNWDVTAACLATLRPTLRPRDQVVVVDNGSVDSTASRLALHPWLSVVTNAENRGFAAANNQGAALATGEVVVFLNNDTLLSGRWLDDLLAPFADPSVGATGPRSNFVSGPQLVDAVGYGVGRMGELRAWARQWRDRNRGHTTEAGRLVGFCLAVRRTALEGVGGWDESFGMGGFEDDDLCARLTAAGWRLLIADAAFVHHHGHSTFDANGVDWLAAQNANQARFQAKHAARQGKGRRPLLVACIIARDEEANLPRCLASLDGVVDRVVVYDTGSSDGTTEVARASGATVVAGYWDDDFSRARNAALGHCRDATWVLSIDADEVIECDPADLRASLQQAAAADAVQIAICNLEGTTAAHRESVGHQAYRLLRADRACWEGRLHEQPVARPGQRPLHRAALPRVRLVHWGYLTDVAAERAKPERNLRLAALAADESAEPDAVRLCNLGRSLLWAGRPAEALQQLVLSRDAAADDRQRCQAQRFAIDALMALHRPGEAGRWAAELAANPAAPATLAAFYRAIVALAAGRPAETLALLDGVTQVATEDGSVLAPGVVEAKRGLARAALEQWEDAVAELRTAARLSPEPVWAALVAAQVRAGSQLSVLAEDVVEADLVRAIGECALLEVELVDCWLDALWRRWPGHPAVAAGALRSAGSLPAVRALEWSVRLRQSGFGPGADRSDPLAARLGDRAAPASDRVRAAAILAGAFGDEPDAGELADASRSLAQDELEPALVELDRLAPRLLPAVVAGAATNRARCLALATLLTGWGAPEEAGVLLQGAFGHRDLVAATKELAGATAP